MSFGRAERKELHYFDVCLPLRALPTPRCTRCHVCANTASRCFSFRWGINFFLSPRHFIAEDAKLSNQKSRYTRKTCRWFLTRFSMLAGIGYAPGWYADVITSFGWVTLWFSFPNARKLISSNKLTKLNCFRWTFCDGDDVIIASSFALMIRMGLAFVDIWWDCVKSH